MSIYDLATLADQLAELYPGIDDARRILTQAGFNTIEVEFSNRPRDNWWNILQVAAYKKGLLRSLLEIVIKEYRDNQLIPVLLKEIIAFDESPKELESSQPSRRGRLIKAFEEFLQSVRGKSNSKGIFDPQSVKNDEAMQGLEWFRQTMHLSQAVGLIRTPGSTSSAILLRNGYVLTSYLDTTAGSIKNAQLFIQHDVDHNQINKIEKLELDPEFIRNNKELHYTILRRIDHDQNSKLFLPVDVWDKNASEEVNLISHPSGHQKRISGGRITGEHAHELYYTSDAGKGVSGGPVIRNKRVIAVQTGLQEITDSPDNARRVAVKIEDILEDAGLPLRDFMN